MNPSRDVAIRKTFFSYFGSSFSTYFVEHNTQQFLCLSFFHKQSGCYVLLTNKIEKLSIVLNGTMQEWREKRLHFTFIYDFELDMRISDVPFLYFSSSSFFLLAVEMINLELFNHTHIYGKLKTENSFSPSTDNI